MANAMDPATMPMPGPDEARNAMPTDASDPGAKPVHASVYGATPASAKAPRRTRRAPSFVHAATPSATARRHWRPLAAIVALTVLLTLQLLLAQRQELAASARWRPVVSGLCGVLQCDVPPWHEPAAFTMLGRNVQPRPGAPGVLVATASFRNDARWPQPWPTLVLGLSNIDGQPVGQRAFSPREYRGDTADAGELSPGQSATVRFEVLEPAPRIVAFTFDFQ